MSAATPVTAGLLWYWPDGLYFISVVLFGWLVFFFVVVEHGLHLTTDVILHFQSLYCRITLVFPILLTLLYIAACFPWSTAWINFSIALIESYVLCAFFALLLGFGYLSFPLAKLQQELLASRFTKSKLIFDFFHYGPEYDTGEECFKSYQYQVLQLGLFRPLFAFVSALCQSLSVNSDALLVVLNIFGMISLFVAMIAIFRVYRVLNESNKRVFHGHNVLRKFFAIKVTFLLMVLNNIVWSPLVVNGVIPVAPFLCSAQALQLNLDYCQNRLLAVSLLLATTIMTGFAGYSFRHVGLSSVRHKHLLVGENATKMGFVLSLLCGWLDLFAFMNGQLTEHVSEEEKYRLVGESDDDDDEEAEDVL